MDVIKIESGRFVCAGNITLKTISEERISNTVDVLLDDDSCADIAKHTVAGSINNDESSDSSEIVYVCNDGNNTNKRKLDCVGDCVVDGKLDMKKKMTIKEATNNINNNCIDSATII